MGYIAADDILKAREMDLMSYLQNYEPQELVRVSGNTYCTREHESLRISNGKWYWFSHDIGGRSALDYLIKVKDYSFIDAVKTILGNAAVKEPIPYYQKEKVNRELMMPKLDKDTSQVEKYLYNRGIHPAVTFYCIEKKLLFQTEQYHNALFVGYDKEGTPRYGALRATRSPYKGDLTGSNKHYSFSINENPTPEHIHVFESAIDAMSYATMQLLNGKDWKKETFLSLAGVYKTKRENARMEGMELVDKAAVDMDRVDKEGTDMAVIKQTLEGLEILSKPPRAQRTPRQPVIHLPDGLELDDQTLELATLLIAPPGGGKTVLLGRIIEQILPQVTAMRANCFLLDVKGELCKRFGTFPGALRISPSSHSAPAACWNIFRELGAGNDPEIVARDIAKGLLKSQRSDLQPFFENAANDFLVSTLCCMDAKQRQTGDYYGNWHLSDFLKRVSVRRDTPLNWYDLAEQQPQFFSHIPNYLGDELGQGYGIVSELLVLLHSVFYGSMNTPDGQFSCIETVRSGGHLVFLCMDYANESEGSRKAFQTMLHLLLKHSTDADNRCLNYFFLDEGSVIGQVGTADALSLGRACGLRLFMGLQNADLLSLRMTEQERNALLSLFGNLILMNPQDQISRKLFADRFGEALCSWAFTGPMQKPMNHVGYRPVVADSDFALLQRKGDALCSFPRISTHPFYFHSYDPSIED